MYKSMISFIFVFLITLNASAVERPLRYLAIHGGGIAGLAPIYLLKRIEQEIGRPISQVVDGAAGISSGAITASSICGPQPRFSDDKFEEEFIQYARDTFSASNIALRKADSALDNALQKQFGSSYMGQSSCHLAIVAHDRRDNKEVIFDSELAKDPQNDLPVWQAVRASSSIDVPFFGPLSSGTVQYNHSEPRGGFSDPGLHAHADPVPFLLERISALHPNREAVIYSLGTGTSRREPLIHLGHIVVIHLEPNYDDVLGSTLGPLRYTLSVSSNTSAANIDDIEARAKKLLSSWQFATMLKDFKRD